MKKVIALLVSVGLLGIGTPSLATASESYRPAKVSISKVKTIKPANSKKIRKKFIVSNIVDTTTATVDSQTPISKTDTSTSTSATLTMSDFLKLLEMITALSKNSVPSVITTVSPVITVSPSISTIATSSATATSNPVINQLIAPHGGHFDGGNDD